MLLTQASYTPVTALNQAYKNTIYSVFYDTRTIDLRVDIPSIELTHLLKQFKQTTWAFVTAFNPHSQLLTTSENRQRNQFLIQAVGQQGFKTLKATGCDPTGEWPPEESLFIMGITQAKAVALGKQFQQNAILYGEVGMSPTLLWISR